MENDIFIVIYERRDEVIVTTDKDESKMLEDYFKEGTGRDIDEYERYQAPTLPYQVLVVTTQLRADFE